MIHVTGYSINDHITFAHTYSIRNVAKLSGVIVGICINVTSKDSTVDSHVLYSVRLDDDPLGPLVHVLEKNIIIEGSLLPDTSMNLILSGSYSSADYLPEEPLPTPGSTL